MITKQNKGFTLVELIVVVAIVAILAALAAPLVNGYIIDAQEKACLASREILEQDITAALVAEAKDHELHNADKPAIVRKVMIEHGATPKDPTSIYTNFTGICPCGGEYAVFPSADFDASVACLAEEHARHGWVKGDTYERGEILIEDGFVLRCRVTHKSGSRSNTRNPTVKSNKGSWEVIGYPGGVIRNYSPTVRYAEGCLAYYNGKYYSRTNYNLTGGQTPYSNSSSRYWILEGTDIPEYDPGD